MEIRRIMRLTGNSVAVTLLPSTQTSPVQIRLTRPTKKRSVGYRTALFHFLNRHPLWCRHGESTGQAHRNRLESGLMGDHWGAGPRLFANHKPYALLVYGSRRYRGYLFWAKLNILRRNSFYGEIRICKLCGNKFEPVKLGAVRKYCYDCSPS